MFLIFILSILIKGLVRIRLTFLQAVALLVGPAAQVQAGAGSWKCQEAYAQAIALAGPDRVVEAWKEASAFVHRRWPDIQKGVTRMLGP